MQSALRGQKGRALAYERKSVIVGAASKIQRRYAARLGYKRAQKEIDEMLKEREKAKQRALEEFEAECATQVQAFFRGAKDRQMVRSSTHACCALLPPRTCHCSCGGGGGGGGGDVVCSNPDLWWIPLSSSAGGSEEAEACKETQGASKQRGRDEGKAGSHGIRKKEETWKPEAWPIALAAVFLVVGWLAVFPVLGWLAEKEEVNALVEKIPNFY